MIMSPVLLSKERSAAALEHAPDLKGVAIVTSVAEG